MALINEHFLKLQNNYLFSDIAKKVNSFKVTHPKEKIIRMGIGDVTQPLAPAVIEAMHKAVDEMASKDTFHGYVPEQGYPFLIDAIIKNDYKIDAVFAHNDIFAGAAAEVVKELGIKNPVIITGMDAETPALKRLLEGTQDATVYMDLKSMAYTAVNEAYNMATKKKPNVNSEFDNESKFKIDAFLINGKLITRENIDRVLIAPGHFTHEQIYGN